MRANSVGDLTVTVSDGRRHTMLDRIATGVFILGALAMAAMLLLAIFYPELALRWR